MWACGVPQDPAAADKLTKIQRDLDETKIILHKTIESVLDRGEKLDQVWGGRAGWVGGGCWACDTGQATGCE